MIPMQTGRLPHPDFSADVQSAVNTFLSRVREVLGRNLVDVRLFGSYARGDNRPDSDIDIALIVETDRVQAEDLAIDIAFDINVARDLYISPRVVERRVLDDPVWQATAFVQNLQSEGVPL